MSTKTLADVVEALIGAAYLSGGLPKAATCLKIFLPEVPWYVFSESVFPLLDRTLSMEACLRSV